MPVESLINTLLTGYVVLRSSAARRARLVTLIYVFSTYKKSTTTIRRRFNSPWNML